MPQRKIFAATVFLIFDFEPFIGERGEKRKDRQFLKLPVTVYGQISKLAYTPSDQIIGIKNTDFHGWPLGSRSGKYRPREWSNEWIACSRRVIQPKLKMTHNIQVLFEINNIPFCDYPIAYSDVSRYQGKRSIGT